MGLCYLDALPDGKGRPVIRTCFQHRNPFSEQEAQKLVQIAERYGFGDESEFELSIAYQLRYVSRLI